MKLPLCLVGLALWVLGTGPPGFAQLRYPMPGRSPSTYPGGGRRTPRTGEQKPPDEALPSFKGTVRSVNGSKLTVETEESNTLEFRSSKKTKFYNGDKKAKSADLKVGDQVSIEARRSPDGSLDAVNIRMEHPKS